MYGMYRVDEATCTGCGECVEACPTEAIALMDGRAHIDDAACIDCRSCADACPQGAIAMVGAAEPAYAATVPGISGPALVPAIVPSAAATLLPRPEAEHPPVEPRHSRIWPLVGGALIWAARELLPEVIAAWRASRSGTLQPASRRSTTVGLAAVAHRRAGRRHRWGRA
jgi:Fe-S-cluster-containing hydrogenase component 2